MPSATEPTAHIAPDPAPRSDRFAGFERWNRKLHFYFGLYFLFFLWLFAVSGLLLNHPAWTFHEHWKNRKETITEIPIKPPPPEAVGDLAQAQDIMRQLNITGDILWTTPHTDPSVFIFQVRRPGHFFFINANWTKGVANVRYAKVNTWGLIKFLHVFTGNVADDPRNKPDWPLTYMWAYSMDAVAGGLIFMVFSSIYMWLKLPNKRLSGALALALGCLACGLFCLGLRWLF
jgi:hypothetical protein